MRSVRPGLLAVAAAVAVPACAQAVPVTFTGAVVNQCVLTLTTPGTLALSSGGTSLSSDEAGGISAVLAVVATGSNPVLAFGAPTLAGPSTSAAGATKEIAYTSLGGAAQAYTSGSSSFTTNRLLDTVTLRGRATNSAGFASGTYTLSTTVTCQQ